MLLLLLLMLHQLAHVDAEADAAGQRHARSLREGSLGPFGGGIDRRRSSSRGASVTVASARRSPRVAADPGRARWRVLDDAHPRAGGKHDDDSREASRCTSAPPPRRGIDTLVSVYSTLYRGRVTVQPILLTAVTSSVKSQPRMPLLASRDTNATTRRHVR